MLGYLLSRAGVDVYVLEKHTDFLRDFRGDTIHSSTLELMHELGLLEEFLKLPHQRVLELAEVQRRREFPTRATQRMQTIVQNHVLARVLGSDEPISMPWPLKLFRNWRFLRRIPARIIGVGFRPEHIKTPMVGVA